MVYNPGDDPTPFLPQGQDFSRMGDQLMGFLNDPRGQAALMSGGLAMMQPPAWGDNFTSQLGRAIGAGGESVRTSEALDLKQQEAESKADLRGAQAGAAEARAGTAGARSETASARLALQAQGLQQLQERNLANQRIRVNAMYSNYLKQLKDENLLLPADKKKQPLLQDEWVRSNPLLKTLGLVPDADASVPEPGAATPSTPPSTTSPKVGDIKPGKAGNYRFKGGDQYDSKNWELVK